MNQELLIRATKFAQTNIRLVGPKRGFDLSKGLTNIRERISRLIPKDIISDIFSDVEVEKPKYIHPCSHSFSPFLSSSTTAIFYLIRIANKIKTAIIRTVVMPVQIKIRLSMDSRHHQVLISFFISHSFSGCGVDFKSSGFS